MITISVAAGAVAEANVERFFPSYIYEGILKQDAEGLVSGTHVRLYEAESEKYYLVGGSKGARVRVPWEVIEPIPKNEPVLPSVDADKIALYAGEHLSSKTDYILWVDLSRIRLYVLEYADEGWQVIRSLPCTVGDAAHPTPSGRFEISYKCASIGKESLYLCRYALCFYGGKNNIFRRAHTFDWGGSEIIDGRMGMRISHGCVRLRQEDSRWLYESIPIGSTVFIR